MKCVVNEHCNPFLEIAVTVKRFRREPLHGYMETLIKQAKSTSASLTLISILTFYFRMKITTAEEICADSSTQQSDAKPYLSTFRLREWNDFFSPYGGLFSVQFRYCPFHFFPKPET